MTRHLRGVLVGLSLLWPTPAWAATYYVATTGSDAVSCATAQTITTPKLTLVSAIACLTAGDELQVRAGTYTQQIATVPSGTSWAAKVRIVAYTGETVWITPTASVTADNVIWLDCNCSYIEFDGINLDGTLAGAAGLWVSTNNLLNPHHIRIQNATIIAGTQGSQAGVSFGAHQTIGSVGGNEAINLTIHGGGIAGECGFACSSYGVYLAGPNNLVEGNTIYDVSGFGIQIYNGTGDPAINNVVRKNIIRDISRRGEVSQIGGMMISAASNQIYNNLIYNIAVSGAGRGLETFGGIADNNLLYNNTIYNVAATGIHIDTGAAGTELKNNIIWGQGGTAIVNDGTGTVQTTNLITNPSFTNGPGGDFTLALGSAALDTGTDLSGTFTTDLTGATRVAPWDIGAYERSGGVPADPPNGLWTGGTGHSGATGSRARRRMR